MAPGGAEIKHGLTGLAQIISGLDMEEHMLMGFSRVYCRPMAQALVRLVDEKHKMVKSLVGEYAAETRTTTQLLVFSPTPAATSKPLASTKNPSDSPSFSTNPNRNQDLLSPNRSNLTASRAPSAETIAKNFG
ncbi:glycylpeptide N-tetradecanoyltransferase 1 [Pyrus ussuriensis x Pyrus communis]|uniref:Glycylpeptide N-tetradecanoyltransferase 1 n=1 Tax=Pyrus ussuriensis x Pyrus communis TaxID=2448454 RepID=A0A5N5FSH3_9ROSA|nr:glycylpeptide N-tetradecanoyltransferase 1 [Pyrus ussuriensis x Pyrus communis]